MNKVEFLRFVNKYILFLFLVILFPFRKLFKTKYKTGKVLVIRLWGLGDSVNVLPVLKRLKSKYMQVDVLTTNEISFVFKSQDFIDNIHLFNYYNPFNLLKLVFKLRSQKYEVIIDTEQFLNVSTIYGLFIGSFQFIGYNHLLRKHFYNINIEYEENQHFVYNFFKLLKPLNLNKKPYNLVPFKYSKNSVSKVDRLLNNTKKIIGIHLGTGGTATSRRWSALKFAKLANRISKEYKEVVIAFTGLEEEKKIYQRIENKLQVNNQLLLFNKLNLSDFIYFLSKIDLFISNDTGPMHMAAAMNTKVIGLFGLNNPKKVGAWPIHKNINIYKNPNSYPIINNKYSIYPKDKYSTIDLIEVDEVFSEVKKILK